MNVLLSQQNTNTIVRVRLKMPSIVFGKLPQVAPRLPTQHQKCKQLNQTSALLTFFENHKKIAIMIMAIFGPNMA